MSWLFSRALVADFSAATSWDGGPCALSNGNPTPQAFLPPDRTTAFSRPSRFGMTFGPLTDTLGAELLTWFLAASPARTSASPARAQASTASAAGCGGTWRASLARFDPASRSWRTAQHSLLGDSTESSVTWPRSGMTADGRCWELPMSARRTNEIGSGSWQWPTPNVPNGGRSVKHVTDWRGPKTAYHNGKKVQVVLEAAVKMFPTPTASLGTKGGRVTPRKGREGGTLIEAMSARTRWPTPHGFSPDGKTNGPSGNELGRAVNQSLPSDRTGGSLNPTWVEWLMGWPLGWTDLKPLGTAKFPSAQPQRGSTSLAARIDA